jgi:hypothetical protein
MCVPVASVLVEIQDALSTKGYKLVEPKSLTRFCRNVCTPALASYLLHIYAH